LSAKLALFSHVSKNNKVFYFLIHHKDTLFLTKKLVKIKTLTKFLVLVLNLKTTYFIFFTYTTDNFLSLKYMP